MRWLTLAAALLLAGCTQDPAAPADGGDTGGRQSSENVEAWPPYTGHYAWANATESGTFTGYSVFPVAAGSLEEDTVFSFDVKENATMLRLTLTADPPDNVEYYVAPPSCNEPSVADCRGFTESGFTDDSFMVWENATPEAGTWRFELAGSGSLTPQASRVTWEMHIDRRQPP